MNLTDFSGLQRLSSDPVGFFIFVFVVVVCALCTYWAWLIFRFIIRLLWRGAKWLFAKPDEFADEG